MDKPKQEEKVEHLRPTGWPGRKLPVPAVAVYPVSLSDGGKNGEILYYATLASAVKEVCLPEDFYLRELFVLDLSSGEEILQFSKDWGRLSSPGWRDLPDEDYGFEASVCASVKLIDGMRDRYFEAKGLVHPRDKKEFASMYEFVVHANVLRDLVRVWLSLKDEIPFSEMASRWKNALTPAPANELESASFLEVFLNAGLRPFHAHVTVESPKIERSQTPLPPYRRISLYSAICLQLANDIEENSTYRRCANETCSRIFSKQRGRSQKGYHKTRGDIYYCDKHCAKAQAQRRLRRRMKEARRLQVEGKSPGEIAGEINTDLEAVKRWLAKPKPKKG